MKTIQLTANQFNEVKRMIFASANFTPYVWFLGKTWRNPMLPLDHRGHMSLESLTRDGEGILADPERIRSCSSEQISAIEYFLNLRQKP